MRRTHFIQSQLFRLLSLVCLGYAFWIVLDASFWYYYSPNIVPTIIKFNGVKLLYGEVLCLLFTLGQWKALKMYSSHRILSTAGAAGTALLFTFTLAFLSDLQSHYWQTGTMVIQIFQTFGRVLFTTVILTCGLLGLFYVSYYQKITAQQREQLIRAKALADEAQLLMLRYQINPHFLFNSLNAIQSMIEKDKDQAKDMIADLSDFFRYTLSKNNQSLVPLKEELDAIRNYLAIQKERFINRLEIRYDIEDSVLQIQVPFFLIHPLVENAVKYGISSSHDDMHILIKAARTGQKLVLLVRNTGRLLTSEETNAISAPGTKTGIENIKKRLSLFYPDSSSFELFEQDQCVHARITITHPSLTA